MKKILPLIVIAFLFTCKSIVKTTSSSNSNSVQETESKIIPVTASELEKLMTYLASDKLKGRDTGSEGINQAASYIEVKFKSFGLKPYFQAFRDNFKVSDLDAFNVVGYLEGNDPKLKEEVVIIGAHYDHIGVVQTKEGDSIANGANDNAAGSSAVISMAKHFAKSKSNKRSIMFVLFSAEEKGLLGSKHLATRLIDDNLDIYTMFNIEMIGVPMKSDKNFKAYLTGHKLSNMSDKFNTYAKDDNFIGFYELAETYQLFKRSDNYPFYEAFKIPAQTLSTSDDYKQYHQVDDEIDQLDFNHMARIINILIPVVETMCNTLTKEIVINNE